MKEHLINLNLLIEIRESTGLIQKDFYRTYLKDVDKPKVLRKKRDETEEAFSKRKSMGTSEETDQSTMSAYETGEKEIPKSFLPVYAKIGGCSIEDLFNKSVLNMDIKKANKIDSLADVLERLFAIDEVLPISFSKVTIEQTTRFAGVKSEKELTCIYFDSPAMDHILTEFEYLKGMPDMKDLKNGTLERWKKGALEEGKKRLTKYQFLTPIERAKRSADNILFGYSNVGDTYNTTLTNDDLENLRQNLWNISLFYNQDVFEIIKRYVNEVRN